MLGAIAIPAIAAPFHCTRVTLYCSNRVLRGGAYNVGESVVAHVHAGGTHTAADHASHAVTHHHKRPAISLLGTSVLFRLAIVAAVCALLWLAILWALA
jgi:hypothetical protein